MAIIRIHEIRKLAKEERAKRLSELKAELSKLMATKAMGGSIENPGRIRLLKKTIARFHTVAREEELGIAKVETEGKSPKAEKPAKAEAEAEKPAKAEAEVEKPAKAEKPAKVEPEAPEAEEAGAAEEPAAKESKPKAKKTKAKKEAPKE
jgi:large subunit ribosomal protein L29